MNVALLGCGGYGQALAEAMAVIDGAVIIAAFDPVSQRMRKVNAGRQYKEADEALAVDGLDAVLIASPNQYHQEQALAALERGLHVFVEKPLAVDSAGAFAVVKTALEGKLTLVAGHNLELLEPLAELRARAVSHPVRSGRISFSRSLGGAEQEGDWRFNPGFCPGGPLLQMGIHGVGIFLDWFGPARDVAGETEKYNGNDLPMAGSITWQTTSGVPLRVDSDYLGRGPFIKLELDTCAGVYRLEPGLVEGPGWRHEWDMESAFRSSRQALLERFFRAIQGGEPGNGPHSLAALEVVEQALSR